MTYYLPKEMIKDFNDQTDGVKAYSNAECECVELRHHRRKETSMKSLQ